MPVEVQLAILSLLTAVLGGGVVKFIDWQIAKAEARREASKDKSTRDAEADKVKSELALTDRDQLIKFMVDQRAEIRRLNVKIESVSAQNLTLLQTNYEQGKKLALMEQDAAEYGEDRKQWDRDRSMWYEERQRWMEERVKLQSQITELQAEVGKLKKTVGSDGQGNA